MNKIFLAVSLAITVIMGVVLADTLLNPANAAGCSTSNVAKCGVWSVSEMRNAYNKDTTPGLKNIFHGMGISGDMVNKSTVKEGTVGKDGNIIVGGKVVGTNAVSAGRTAMSHTKERVKHEKNGTIYYSSPTYDSFRSTKLDAYVFFDADGRFQAAVIKECGNPVKGKPTQPEKPKEQPKKIEVCRLSDKKYPVTIDEKDFDKTKYSKNPEDCKEKEQPKTMVVCVLETKEYPKTINEADFDKSKHSENAEDCKEEEVPPVVELPKTGVADGLASALGVGSMVTAGIAYLASRRNL